MDFQADVWWLSARYQRTARGNGPAAPASLDHSDDRSASTPLGHKTGAKVGEGGGGGTASLVHEGSLAPCDGDDGPVAAASLPRRNGGSASSVKGKRVYMKASPGTKEPRVGNDYQANIPDLLTVEEKAGERKAAKSGQIGGTLVSCTVHVVFSFVRIGHLMLTGAAAT